VGRVDFKDALKNEQNLLAKEEGSASGAAWMKTLGCGNARQHGKVKDKGHDVTEGNGGGTTFGNQIILGINEAFRDLSCLF
jgi:hypothetical protein